MYHSLLDNAPKTTYSWVRYPKENIELNLRT